MELVGVRIGIIVRSECVSLCNFKKIELNEFIQQQKTINTNLMILFVNRLVFNIVHCCRYWWRWNGHPIIFTHL